jgi:hypothetical protein
MTEIRENQEWMAMLIYLDLLTRFSPAPSLSPMQLLIVSDFWNGGSSNADSYVQELDVHKKISLTVFNLGWQRGRDNPSHCVSEEKLALIKTQRCRRRYLDIPFRIKAKSELC